MITKAKKYLSILKIINVTIEGDVYFKGKALIGYDNGKGYKAVSINRNNYYIHRLVAFAYIHNPEGKDYVNHIDCDKSNNRASNLEWCTNKENVAHALANNRYYASEHQKRITSMCNRGVKNKNSKLTESQVLEIRKLKNTGISNKSIGNEYGVCHTTIGDIFRGRSWTHI